MKKFFKNWMVLFGLVTISAHIVPSLFNGYWEIAISIIKLLAVTLVVCLLQLLTNKITVRTPLIKYLIDLGMVLGIVLFFGWIWEWYSAKNVWLVFVMVIPVFAAGYFLDLIYVRQDVNFINQQIKRRREKILKEINE